MSKLYQYFTQLADASIEEQQQEITQLAAADVEFSQQLASLLSQTNKPLSTLLEPIHQAFITQENPNVRIGRVIDGKYQIIALLGQGGMSDVYKAPRIDGLIEHHVAIKYFALAESNDVALTMVKKEARILEKLDHQYIASFIDIGLDDHQEPNLMMEYIDGVTLALFLQNSPDKAAVDRVNTSLSQAVEYATSQGCEHGDLSKNNIIVDKAGDANVVDFDIATYTLPTSR